MISNNKPFVSAEKMPSIYKIKIEIDPVTGEFTRECYFSPICMAFIGANKCDVCDYNCGTQKHFVRCSHTGWEQYICNHKYEDEKR